MPKGKGSFQGFLSWQLRARFGRKTIFSDFCVRIYQFTWFFLISDCDYIWHSGNISVHNLEVSLSYKVVLSWVAIMIIEVFQEIKRNLSLANDFCFGCFVVVVPFTITPATWTTRRTAIVNCFNIMKWVCAGLSFICGVLIDGDAVVYCLSLRKQ